MTDDIKRKKQDTKSVALLYAALPEPKRRLLLGIAMGLSMDAIGRIDTAAAMNKNDRAV